MKNLLAIMIGFVVFFTTIGIGIFLHWLAGGEIGRSTSFALNLGLAIFAGVVFGFIASVVVADRMTK